ncbi:MAG: hypothetical protein MUF84_13530, partial [Anaerolineae bacterium]|nr:hypothetical protein [Anaerolineae bacterium]
MLEPQGLRVGYAVFALALMALLTVNFTARLMGPEFEQRFGWLVYTLLVVGGLTLAIVLTVRHVPTNFVIGPWLLVAWAAFGLIVDPILKIPWRDPPRLAIFIPYVAGYTVTLFGFLFPMWDLGKGWGIAYTVLCVAQYA